MEDKRKHHITEWIAIGVSIIAVLVSVYFSNIENKRDIRITNVQVQGVSYPSALEEGRSIETGWDFLDAFSDTFVQFHAENHSKFDIEIYGFYVEAQVDTLVAERIMIPMETSFKGTDITVSSYLSDWEVTTEIDKCTLKALSTHEAYADIGSMIQSGPASWYISSEWAEDDNPVVNRINSRLSNGKDLDFKIRIVCKDTFGNFYNSEWIEYSLSAG